MKIFIAAAAFGCTVLTVGLAVLPAEASAFAAKAAVDTHIQGGSAGQPACSGSRLEAGQAFGIA